MKQKTNVHIYKINLIFDLRNDRTYFFYHTL